jgi:excisionase family DNA binding protein
MSSDIENGLVGIKFLVGYLALSLRTVHRLIASGALPSIKIGNRRLVRRSALEAWLSGRVEQNENAGVR